jgi:Domain of unknown function (DUF4424)
MKMRLVIAVLVFMCAGCAARANDSTAEMAVGGLVLTQSDAISLDSEDLFISKGEVRVDYVFTNTTGKDVETLVAFPLPDQVMDESGDGYFRNLKAELGFETRVDGVAVQYDIVEQAIHQGADVTARIAALGLPLNNIDDAEQFTAKVKALPAAVRKALEADGLLFAQDYDAGQGPQTAWQPLWGLRLTVTRKQVFPAGKSVKVQHRYTPLLGGSVGGNFSPEYRNDESLKWHREKFCIEDSWLKSFDKAAARHVSKEQGIAPYGETWLGYVLTSGANWKGPIKDFRMIIDKGKPDALVSFCAEGVKKISPTQFEVRKTDYEPKADVIVLIVDWAE